MHGMTEARGRDVVDGFEDAGKVERILEAQRGGYGFHGSIALQQKPRGVLHPQAC